MRDLFDKPPFAIKQAEKEQILLEELNRLTELHRGGCQAYERILRAFHPGQASADALEQVPWLPVGLFKSHRLVSVPESLIFKTLTSSGTTGQQVSRIYLDRETAAGQTRALAHIMSSVLGKRRLPTIIVDTKTLLKDRSQFSARGAGVLGMMNFGRAHFWALDDQMELDMDGLSQFLQTHSGQPIMIFGFTFMVWKYFLQRLEEQNLDLSLGVLIHSGGWKKLADEAVDNAEFKRRFHASTGLARIHNFYGMVEQVGSVFLEGEDGFLHPPSYADVIVRNPQTWEPCPIGEPGVLQVLSALPGSYPGHSLLTEDLGVIRGVDASDDMWMGKRFEVLGRVPKAELRGCSDVHAYDAGSVTL
jgi:hypothetical protein